MFLVSGGAGIQPHLLGGCGDRHLGGVGQVISGHDVHAGLGQHFASGLYVGTLQPHHHGQGQTHFLDGGDDAFGDGVATDDACLLYTSPSPRDGLLSRMPSSA